MKKTKLTRSLLAACSIVALSVVLSGCLHSSDDSTTTGPDMTGEPDPAIGERAAINTAIMAADTAVAGIGDDSTDSEVNAANMAVAAARTAISNAENLPETETAAHTARVNTIANRLSAALESRTAAMDAADEQMRKDMAATGKAMHAALGGNATADTTALDNATAALSATGLLITAVDGAGAIADGTIPPAVTLTAGDSAGELGSWSGTNYAHTDTGTKIENAAVVYTNQGPGKRVSFADTDYTVATDTSGGDIKGYVTLTVSDTETLGRIMAPAFTHSGTQSHQQADREDAVYIRGTYDGAPGEYRCTGTCTSTNDGKGSPSALAGTTWHFKPDAGAMVHQPDTTYLHFGWWLSKDKDGDPTAASAFIGTVGTIAALPVNPDTLTGSATYAGKAAGKFAMSNVLDGTGNGGHFTADAMLTAKFGANASPNNGGVSGTINNFRLNDASEDAGWSVELKRAGWDSGADTFGGSGNEAMTVWSIDGNKAPESGTWSGQVYDEMPGDAPDGDGSNIPTTVTGTFYSEFSTIGRMVGAFGATKDE